MAKQNVLDHMEHLVKEGNLTKEEILAVIDRVAKSERQDKLIKQSHISNILYYIGGGIVFLGICVFVGTNWSNLNDFTKIFATLGSSVLIYFAATLISGYDYLDKISDAFYFIAGLIAPLGIFVTMDIAGVNIDTAGSHFLVAATCLTVNLLYNFIQRRQVFTVFNVIHGTWGFFALTTFLIGGRPFMEWDFIKYRWLIVGLTHMTLGYAFVKTENKELTRYLYGFGVIEFLTAALSLGGWHASLNLVWELIFPGLTFGIIFMSIYLKARSFLLFGALYLMIYIIKITNEYFTSGFGWSLSLIIIGFALMSIGYFSFYLNKKYISNSS